MNTALSIVLLILQGVRAFLENRSVRSQMDVAVKVKLADSLLELARMVADAQAISDWVRRQPSDVVDRILSDYYTRPRG